MKPLPLTVGIESMGGLVIASQKGYSGGPHWLSMALRLNILAALVSCAQSVAGSSGRQYTEVRTE